ncbi:uncharacterized protein L201_003932 [Kwoniella dendrophila CBS 6074]|uniref:Uncharacterized protein n=1 Tax=Kwoniella dendrophila CBS 6074 TaxID=1295534 RepID=A0AAX4JVS8_9TREE
MNSQTSSQLSTNALIQTRNQGVMQQFTKLNDEMRRFQKEVLSYKKTNWHDRIASDDSTRFRDPSHKADLVNKYINGMIDGKIARTVGCGASDIKIDSDGNTAYKPIINVNLDNMSDLKFDDYTNRTNDKIIRNIASAAFVKVFSPNGGLNSDIAELGVNWLEDAKPSTETLEKVIEFNKGKYTLHADSEDGFKPDPNTQSLVYSRNFGIEITPNKLDSLIEQYELEADKESELAEERSKKYPNIDYQRLSQSKWSDDKRRQIEENRKRREESFNEDIQRGLNETIDSYIHSSNNSNDDNEWLGKGNLLNVFHQPDVVSSNSKNQGQTVSTANLGSGITMNFWKSNDTSSNRGFLPTIDELNDRLSKAQ